MHLQAVIVPPPGVMDGALQVLADIFEPDSAPVPVPRRSLLGRLRTSEAAATVSEVVWEPSPPDAVFVRVCKFGNVTLTDAQSLVKAFEEAASTWATPLVRVVDIHLGEAAPFSVTARLEGELDVLADIFRGTLEVAQEQGFFLDRRSFRSELSLGSVAAPPDAMVPESLPGAVIPVDGVAWQVTHLQLLRMTRQGTDTTFTQLAAVPLGGRAANLDARATLTA